ncbi:hypothetical protein [Otoolea muris]|uniref:hypothetical protein n=1 Tax=Otoolea muris TaxID=2941515 RepID=UPI00203DD067|nr:hypothetical protein [Otoolea muris]
MQPPDSRQEEITNRRGRRRLMRRADILKVYFENVIKAVRDLFKCRVDAEFFDGTK